jgi:hypothetical protein
MRETLNYLRANGYKTYIVTGGGQDFVRVYAEQTYGIPPEQGVGTAGGTAYGYAKDGQPVLTKEPKLLLNDDNASKPEGIHLMIGRHPYAAFGNSTGDRQRLEYTKAGGGARLSMIVLHDDAAREYAYGPALGLPGTRVGTFTQAPSDEAQQRGWVVISMQHDWKRVFAFEPWGSLMDLSTHPVLIVMTIAAVAPMLVELPHGFRLPAVVLEMAPGIVVVPQVLGRTVAQRLSPQASASLGGKRSKSSSA